ncbi:MAG: hypothetical protein ABIK09_17055 [Pseudomonadota bacterium]
MRSILRFAIRPLLLVACLAAPATALGDAIPWEIANHPNPCLEHKARCEARIAHGQYEEAICKTLQMNCALDTKGEYNPQKVKSVLKPVRLKNEPDACWEYRLEDCNNCATGCDQCLGLVSQCKDQLYFQWMSAVLKDGQTKSAPATTTPAKKPYKPTTKKKPPLKAHKPTHVKKPPHKRH